MEVVITDHAVARYRERVDPFATVDTIAGLIVRGRVATQWAGHVSHGGGWVVVDAGAFPLKRKGGEVFVVTFLNRQRRSKADRRAFREEQRDDMWLDYKEAA